MAKIFGWKKNSIFSTSINIYTEDKMIGYIPDPQLRKPAEINGKKFIAEYTKKNISQETFTIIDFNL